MHTIAHGVPEHRPFEEHNTAKRAHATIPPGHQTYWQRHLQSLKTGAAQQPRACDLQVKNSCKAALQANNVFLLVFVTFAGCRVRALRAVGAERGKGWAKPIVRVSTGRVWGRGGGGKATLGAAGCCVCTLGEASTAPRPGACPSLFLAPFFPADMHFCTRSCCPSSSVPSHLSASSYPSSYTTITPELCNMCHANAMPG